MSDQESGVTALTPGHFLIGNALLSPAEPFADEKLSVPSRWTLLCQMRNHFWRRWQQEFLQQLQA